MSKKLKVYLKNDKEKWLSEFIIYELHVNKQNSMNCNFVKIYFLRAKAMPKMEKC